MTSAGDPRHPMGVVMQRTGLTSDVVRAWERRYGVVSPKRSKGGHRLYSDADVERLRVLHRLTLGGRQIGRLAGLSDEQLADLLVEDEAAGATAPRRPEVPELTASLLEEALELVRDLDGEGLDRVLRRAVLTLSTTAFLDGLLGPLLERIGRAWEDGTLTPAHEHLASAVSARVGGWLLDSFRSEEGASRLVVCTTTGQAHDLGALGAAITAAADGWHVRYLGADLPAHDIATAAAQSGAAAVAVSLVHPRNDRSTAHELETLAAALPPGVALIVGGGAADSYSDLLERIRAVRLDSFEDLRAYLSRVAAA